jgi:hypothetical protein
MPKTTGSLEGLMNEFWNLKYTLNKATGLMDNQSYDQIQGIKNLIRRAETYCLDNNVYESVSELEDEEFKATRPVINKEETESKEV